MKTFLYAFAGFLLAFWLLIGCKKNDPNEDWQFLPCSDSLRFDTLRFDVGLIQPKYYYYGDGTQLYVEPQNLPPNANFQWSDSFPSINRTFNSDVSVYYSYQQNDSTRREGNLKLLLSFVNSISVNVPDAFSPNDDGLNDVFVAQTNKSPTIYRMKVFDMRFKTPQIVFETETPLHSWNGNKNNTGERMPAGAYFYELELGFNCVKNTQKFSGWVQLLR